MSIAITGASGPFGRRCAELLAERVGAAELRLLTRRPDALSETAPRGAELRRGDFDDAAGLVEALRGCERMLMISTDAVGGKRLAQHRRAVDAARAAGVRHIVYTSFIAAVEGNPAISAREHAATEAMLHASGMAWTMLRDNQYTEALALFAAPGALASGQWLSASGDGRLALVSREDCVASAAAVLAGDGHAGKTYDITGPELVSYADCAALAAEFGGRPVNYVRCSDEQKLAFFDALGVPRRIEGDEPIRGPIPWPSEEMVSFERAIREGWFAVRSDAVEQLTGRRPASPREVFTRHAEAIRGAVPR